MIALLLLAGALSLFSGTPLQAGAPQPARPRITSLDGTWQLAEGQMEVIPQKFEHTVPVPGLVDLATPPFAEPGPAWYQGDDKGPAYKTIQKDPRRDAFWYRRTFTSQGPAPARAWIKITKAFYGTRVFLNGRLLGDHAPCVTPGYFDAAGLLKTGENELLIRVGADTAALGPGIPAGADYEKTRYIPGIFDSVELITSGPEHIANVQVAPDIAKAQAKVRLYLECAQATGVRVEIREAKSGKLVGQAAARAPAGTNELDLAVPIAHCRLWSPEAPFLYELRATTANDSFSTRFGMREFHFDPATKRAFLNGKLYYLRGSNLAVYRFFEDAERAQLPWDEHWVRALARKLKGMHWNCVRFHVSQPPTLWYRILDEEGLLLQNEFPIWHGGADWSDYPKELTREELAREFSEWLPEQWNHPCIVIWDASNETSTPELPPAVQAVRQLDLSHRPWDNGYCKPAEPGDSFEAHPYHFGPHVNTNLTILEHAKADPGDGRHAVINNEYGWLWLHRDGTPCPRTTGALYEYLLGKNPSPEQCRHLYATYTAAETEFWRHHRHCAAVMHFVALTCNRPPTAETSDHWLPGRVAALEWEPEFYKYVRDAFAPVSVMIDSFALSHPAGQQKEFPVSLINDLEQPWKGKVRFRLLRNGKTVSETEQSATLAAYGTARLSFNLALPQEPGAYQAQAMLLNSPVGPVSSWRDFTVRKAP